MLGMMIALLSGALMSVQGVFNTGVTKQTGLWVTSCMVQATGFIACLVIWFVTERSKTSFLDLWKIDHKYMLLGGVIGAFITATVVLSMKQLGPAKAVLLIVVAQIVVAYLIELFGLFQAEKADFHWMKLAGLALSIIGIVIFEWKS